jgi:AcrR family transcriptional regulator
MTSTNNPVARIIHSALTIFIARGIQKSSIDEIAKHAGITRITAYRYFDNKKELVKASLLSVVGIFEYVEKEIRTKRILNIEAALDKIKAGLANLPRGNLISLMEELKRLYPDIYDEVNTRRVTSLTKMFEFYYSNRKQISQLRRDLDPLFVQAFFGDIVVNMINSPTFASLGFTQDEIFNNFKNILLHGILKK